MITNEFIRGTLRTIILRLLDQQKQMYGYEITQRVSDLSGDEIKLTYGALYPTLYKLESAGLLVTSTKIVDNRARKYYSLTSSGRKIAKAKVSELRHFTEMLLGILTDNTGPNAIVKAW